MFKKYRINWKAGPGARERGRQYGVGVFVYSRKTRNGFLHEACVRGWLPTVEGPDWRDLEMSARYARRSYANRTWESWSGQSVLRDLWNGLCECPAIDAKAMCPNPFDGRDELEHEDLYEPDEIFGYSAGRARDARKALKEARKEAREAALEEPA